MTFYKMTVTKGNKVIVVNYIASYTIEDADTKANDILNYIRSTKSPKAEYYLDNIDADDWFRATKMLTNSRVYILN